MNKEIEVVKSRKIFIDILRILCCFLVIVNHTNSQIFLSVSSVSEGIGITYILSMAYFYASKIAVPIFFMISGALLLNKDWDIKDFIKKRLLRYIIILIFFSAIYYIYYNKDNDIWHFKNILIFLKNIYNVHITNAFWFLYSYLGILIMLPLLRKMVKHLSKYEYYYLFAIYIIIYSILPIAEKIFKVDGLSMFTRKLIFNETIIYFILGHYLLNVYNIKKINSKRFFIISCITFISYIITSCIYTIITLNNKGEYDLFFADTESIIRLLPSLSIFFIVYIISEKLKLNNKVEKIIIWISKCTLGVYLISDLLIQLTRKIYDKLLVNNVQILIAMVIWELIIFAVGVLITSVLKKVPILRKLL